MERGLLVYDNPAAYFEAYPEAEAFIDWLGRFQGTVFMHQGSGERDVLPGGYIWVQKYDSSRFLQAYYVMAGDSDLDYHVAKSFDTSEKRDAFWESLKQVPPFTVRDLLTQRGFRWR